VFEQQSQQRRRVEIILEIAHAGPHGDCVTRCGCARRPDEAVNDQIGKHDAGAPQQARSLSPRDSHYFTRACANPGNRSGGPRRLGR
jgi:hypothetical protein